MLLHATILLVPFALALLALRPMRLPPTLGSKLLVAAILRTTRE